MEVQMAKNLGLYDSVWGLWIMKANFLGMYFLVFYNIYKNMPMAYTEAACIDGAGNLSVLLRIILPLSRNTFFTVMLINFITFWNDYQTPLLYLPTHPTLSYGVYLVAIDPPSGIKLSDVPHSVSACMMLALPILIVFVIFKDKIMGNISLGGIKE